MAEDVGQATGGGLTYDSAGVSIAAQDEAIARFAADVTASHAAVLEAGSGEVLAGVGAFGAAFVPALAGYTEPVLVSSTDGLGTKTLLHARWGSWELAGRDLVGTVLNDVLCSGAKPLFMLDYIGWHGLSSVQLAEIVRGVAAACTEAQCALVGGELAEMRAIYQRGDFDLTGTAVGVTERSAMLGAQNVEAGAELIGLASSGVHANGFSLVRAALADQAQNIWEQVLKTPQGEQPLWRALVEPTRCYAAALSALRAAGVRLQAAAHISGGGLPDNLPRVIPAGMRAVVERRLVPPQDVFATIRDCGQISRDELWHVFNMGCGFVLIAAAEQAQAAMPVLEQAGFKPFRLGQVVSAAAEPRFAWAD